MIPLEALQENPLHCFFQLQQLHSLHSWACGPFLHLQNQQPVAFKSLWLCSCCCSFIKLCSTLCHPMHWAGQASLSFTISWSLLKFMSIESVMLSNYVYTTLSQLRSSHYLSSFLFSSYKENLPLFSFYKDTWLHSNSPG